jgi:hypothetical protein
MKNERNRYRGGGRKFGRNGERSRRKYDRNGGRGRN